MNKISEVLMNRACGLELMACLMDELISEKRLLPNMDVPRVLRAKEMHFPGGVLTESAGRAGR